MQETDAARLYTDFGGLQQLRSKAAQQSPQANAEVARQFEALYVQMMLKAMRDATAPTGETQNSDQVRFHQDMFDKQVAISLATSSNGIGLAEVIERQLNGPHVKHGGTSTSEQGHDLAMPAESRDDPSGILSLINSQLKLADKTTTSGQE